MIVRTFVTQSQIVGWFKQASAGTYPMVWWILSVGLMDLLLYSRYVSGFDERLGPGWCAKMPPLVFAGLPSHAQGESWHTAGWNSNTNWTNMTNSFVRPKTHMASTPLTI